LASLSTHHITIEDRSAGTPKIGLMLVKRNGGRGLTIADYRTLVPRVLSDAEITQAMLPPEVESIEYQEDWRAGMGGINSRLSRTTDGYGDVYKLGDTIKIDATTKGRLRLARELQATTLDSAPNNYRPSGFARVGTEAWAFVGQDVYSWDYTNKNWDIGTEPVNQAVYYHNGIEFNGTTCVPSWLVTSDAPRPYIYKADADANWILAGDVITSYWFRFFAVANNKIWGGYSVTQAGTTVKNGLRTTTTVNDATTWAGAVTIGESDAEITSLIGAGTGLYICKTDGIWWYDDGATTPADINLTPEFAYIVHPDNGRNSFNWYNALLYPLGAGGLLSYFNGTLYDISLSKTAPELTYLHGRVAAIAGDAARLFILVHDSTNLKYHLLMGDYLTLTDTTTYRWHHVGSIAYTTSTVVNHAALFAESVPATGVVHHRIHVGVNSGGSNLTPYFYTVSDDTESVYTDDQDAEAQTVKIDRGFPHVNKRFGSIDFKTANLAANTDTTINTNEALDDSEVVIDVASDPTSAIAVGDYIAVENEIMGPVTARDATTVTITNRGALGSTAATHTTGQDIYKVSHHIGVMYRVDGGSWAWVTGSDATSRLTTTPQTLTFGAEITGKEIELRFRFFRGSTTTTSPELLSFKLKCQIRTAAVKSLPIMALLADGQPLKNGQAQYTSGSDLTQIETWDAQAGEVVVRIPKGTLPTGTAYNMVFVPGSMKIDEVNNPHMRRPAYAVTCTLVEV